MLIDTLTPGSGHTEDELIDLLPIPVLARLPRLPRRQRRLGSLQVSPAMREALRTVHVQLNLRGQRRRVVMVTSPSPGDGKTTTAVAFGVARQKPAASPAILVDTDVRRAPLHALSGRCGRDLPQPRRSGRRPPPHAAPDRRSTRSFARCRATRTCSSSTAMSSPSTARTEKSQARARPRGQGRRQQRGLRHSQHCSALGGE